MNTIKNVFFVGVILFVMVISLLLRFSFNESPEVVYDIGETDIDLMPDASFFPEALHYAANLSYKVKGVRYYPDREVRPFQQEGIASWYGRDFHGKMTTSGERFDMNEMTAAHPTLPIPSYVRVINLDNQKTVVVRINDRGPFHSKRIIDLSYAAAKKLGFTGRGVAKVRIEQIVAPKPNSGVNEMFVNLDSVDNINDAQKIMQRVVSYLEANEMTQTVSIVHSDDGYMVQVGPFTHDDMAVQLQDDLQKAL